MHAASPGEFGYLQHLSDEPDSAPGLEEPAALPHHAPAQEAGDDHRSTASRAQSGQLSCALMLRALRLFLLTLKKQSMYNLMFLKTIKSRFYIFSCRFKYIKYYLIIYFFYKHYELLIY